MRPSVSNRLGILMALALMALSVGEAGAQRPAARPAQRTLWEYGVASTFYDGTVIRSLRWLEGDSTISVDGNQFGEMAQRIAGHVVPGDGFHGWYSALGEKGWELVLCQESPMGAPGWRDVSCYFKRAKR
jgi:hypothetical protein